MFAELRARMKALGEVIDEHMKGEGFPFEKGVKASLDAMHGTVQELDNRVHDLEVAAGVKGEDEKLANVQAELAEAEHAKAAKPAEEQKAADGEAKHDEGHASGEAGKQAEQPSG